MLNWLKISSFNRRNLWPAALYTSAALFVLGPLLKPGFILTLDMVFTPQLRLPTRIGSDYLFYASLHVLNLVIPSDSIEKGLLFLALFLSGFGMHHLLAAMSDKVVTSSGRIGQYIGGLLYMVNPFTYDRFIAGQYEVLLGYALLPWFTKTLLDVVRQPRRLAALALAAWAITISLVSIHTLGLIAIVSTVVIGTEVWQRRRDKTWRRKASLYLTMSVLIFTVASSYWLVPLSAGKGITANIVTSFTSGDRQAFATVGSNPISKAVHVLRLQGFWAEGRALYNLPQQLVHAWGLLTILIWVIVVIGAIQLWRKKRHLVLEWGCITMVATLLAIGTANNWLANHVPLFSGYREPEKFVALIALTYAIWFAQGITAITTYCRSRAGNVGLIAACIALSLVPLLWTKGMLWGFQGQLQAVHYPADWYTTNQFLDRDQSNFQVLFLPWHLYMAYDFTGRIIANPAPKFFDKPMVISNNLEFNGATPLPNPEASQISTIMAEAPDRTDLASRLASYNIKYVALAQGDDYLRYAYLSRQTNLQRLTKNATLELYRNEAW